MRKVLVKRTTVVLVLLCTLASSLFAGPLLHWTWEKNEQAANLFRLQLDEEASFDIDGSILSYESPYDGNSHTLSIRQSFDGIHWSDPALCTFVPDTIEKKTRPKNSISLTLFPDLQIGDLESQGGWIRNDGKAMAGLGLGLGWSHLLTERFSLGLEASYTYRGTAKDSPYRILALEEITSYRYWMKDRFSLSLGVSLGTTYSSCLGLGSFGYTEGLNHALSYSVSDEASVSLKTKLYAIQEIFENGRLSTVFAVQPLVLAMDVRL